MKKLRDIAGGRRLVVTLVGANIFECFSGSSIIVSYEVRDLLYLVA